MVTNKSLLNLDDITAHVIMDKYGGYDREFHHGDFARHFSGMIVRFIGYGVDADTNKECAVYEEVAGVPERILCVMPKDMFLSTVDRGDVLRAVMGRVREEDKKKPAKPMSKDAGWTPIDINDEIPRDVEITQKYRFDKVYLEKYNHGTYGTSITFNQSSAMDVLQIVRRFLTESYDPEKHDRILVWTAKNYESLSMIRPILNVQYTGAVTKPANMKILNGKSIIEIHTENVTETITVGDVLHWVTEYRIAIENKSAGVYEFFEIVPGISDSY